MEIIFSQFAEEELTDATVYYDEQATGLGDRFLHCIMSTTDLIAQHPKIGSIYQGEFRKRVVPDFPYVVFYVIYPKYIWIQSVFNARRKPDSWINRPRPNNTEN